MMKSTEKSHPIYEKCQSAVSLVFEGKSRKERLLYVASAAALTLLSFVMSAKALPFASLALGIPQADALLCASSVYTPFVFLGTLLGSIYFGAASTLRLLTLTFIFVLRVISGAKAMSGEARSPFSESIVTKTAVSAVMGFIETAIYLTQNGINATSAVVAVATLSILPALTLVFAVYFAKPNKGRTQRFFYELSMLTLFGISVWCAKSVPVPFLSLEALLAVFFILAVAKHGGVARGTLTGFVLGYVASSAYFLSYLLLGAVAAVTFSFGVFSATGIATAVACVSGALISGHYALFSLIPDMIISAAVVSPVIRYSFLPKSFPYPFCDPDEHSELSDAVRLTYAEITSCSALRAISDGLRSLHSEIGEISEKKSRSSHPQTEIRQKICDGFCEKCTMSPICLDTEFAGTALALDDLIEHLAFGCEDVSEGISPYLSAHCIKLRELTEYAASLCREYYAPKALSIAPVTRNSADAALISYTSCADLLEALARNSERELVLDRDAEKKLTDALHRLGVSFSSVAVIGKERKKLYLYGTSKDKLNSVLSELDRELLRIFGHPFAAPRYPSDTDMPTVFTPAEQLRAEASLSYCAKSGETVSGDTALAFNDGDGCFYALIADGMGSGASALRSSSITASLIKNMMLGKIDQRTAVRLAGEALARVCDECFSTVDLMRLDLVSGKTTVTKSYACASYVLRGGSVYLCDANSMPIGIDSESTPFETDFVLTEGDTVIMVSDGIADCSEEELRIPDIIGLSSHLTPKELADRILDKAIEISGKKDDMSALVVRINKAS